LINGGPGGTHHYFHPLKIGFALNDIKNYEEALLLFEKLAKKQYNSEREALSLILQGHMLDLMRREKTTARYDQVVDMNITEQWSHTQYGLQYQISAHAKERLRSHSNG